MFQTKTMAPEQAKLKEAIRNLYAKGYSKDLVEKTINDCHSEIKTFFNIKQT